MEECLVIFANNFLYYSDNLTLVFLRIQIAVHFSCVSLEDVAANELRGGNDR